MGEPENVWMIQKGIQGQDKPVEFYRKGFYKPKNGGIKIVHQDSYSQNRCLLKKKSDIPEEGRT